MQKERRLHELQSKLSAFVYTKARQSTIFYTCEAGILFGRKVTKPPYQFVGSPRRPNLIAHHSGN
jgi:hypothetical protein